MSIVQHLDKPANDALQDQLQQLALNHFTALSALPLPESNPLQPLYQYVLGLEIHRYLARMLEAHHAKPQVVLAFAETAPEQPIGFALYLPCVDNHEACTLLYMVLSTPWQGLGLGGQMLEAIQDRYPHTQVACRADQAEYFVKQGFYPLKAHGPQVLLSTRRQAIIGSFTIEPLEPIFASKEVRQIYTYLLKQHGNLALKAAEIHRDQLLQSLAQEAEQWFRAHLN